MAGQHLFLDQSQFSEKLPNSRKVYSTSLFLHNSFDGSMFPICPDEGGLPPYGRPVPFTMMPRSSNIVTASPPLTDIIIRQPQWSGPSPIISQVRVMYQTSGPPQYTNANTFLSEAARK